MEVEHSFSDHSLILKTENCELRISEFDGAYNGQTWLQDSFEVRLHHDDSLGYSYIVADWKEVTICISDAYLNTMYFRISRKECDEAFRRVSEVWDKLVAQEGFE